ncbi:glycosyltransferase family 2 protein [Acidaminococcus massiliensis]|uniref:glycosyltransferase family 2 protein n=1 Tax=Acidaminococcus massiliensis TaxID=1852375 RepID=UPI0022E84C4F|nr:glycosyltransferase family 2 protein [Acidaminococcus massiliensis]
MSKLSVIIPAYNGGKTIGKCLDSIINSLTDQNVEIICIDDGSKDNTWKILQKYEKNYKFIAIVHKENGGVGSARNLGLKYVTGDYIAWVDSDDYVTSEWYSVIQKNLNNYQPDCFFFDYFITTDGKNSPRHIRLPEVVSLQDFVFEQSLERELKNFLCNQVIRAELFHDVKFNETYHMLEDYEVLTEITPSFRNIRHSKKCLYCYVQNNNSLTHNLNRNILWKNGEIVKKRHLRYSQMGLHVSVNDYLMQLMNYVYSNTEKNIDFYNRGKIIRRFLREHKKEILLNDDISKKNRIKALCTMLGIENLLRFLLYLKSKINESFKKKLGAVH